MHAARRCPRSIRTTLSICMLGCCALLATLGTALAQPLAWSPQRDGSQPMRSLAALAAEAGPVRMQQALLIRNPDPSDGTSEYALADQYGKVQRYVEPTPGVDLASYVGERVAVRSDTGTTLLATQLELPTLAGSGEYRVMQADYQQPRRASDSTASPQRVAQVAPIVVDSYGAASACPSCNVNSYGVPADGGFINGYDGRNSPQAYPPYYNTPDTSFGPSCGRGARGRLYGRAEYLLWWLDGFHVPPLVTTSPAGTAQAAAGVLGQPGTSVLYGNGEILSDRRDGLRFSAGTWLGDYQDIAVEGDIFFFEDASTSFSATGVDGTPILARPYFDVLNAAEAAALVSFPGVTEGTIAVAASSDFDGAGLRLRKALCCKEIGGACNACNPSGPAVIPASVSRIDMVGGYRYLNLDEQLTISAATSTLLTVAVTQDTVFDRFSTSNEFHGGDLGFIWEWESAQWSLELLSKMAIGTTRQQVSVSGGSTIGGVSGTGGLLALPSNIGTYNRNIFSVVPELGVTLGYKITPRLKATAGYTLIYWSHVARPGDVIDLDVNTNQLPPAVPPFAGPARPRFEWDDSALIAHGLSLGLDYRF